MNTSAKKELIRKRLLEERREMSFETVYELSLRAQKRLLKTSLFRDAARVCLYCSSQNEVLTDEVFEQAKALGKEVFYPRVVVSGAKRRLGFFRVHGLEELSPGAYEIPEPAGGAELESPEGFDLIVVPGVAFDERGGRLGFGKGYYDMALSGAPARTMALAYEFQVLKNQQIPVEPHDVMVSAIVTEERVIRTGS
ncbi:MAG: 5-formyltetrahydrofolate cyclo-ligase [Deltaproteobacteria bacterium]|nr:5-formyltetrahydrofolate cyclo-ligase [Deltaproteobacteria bacterium]